MMDLMSWMGWIVHIALTVGWYTMAVAGFLLFITVVPISIARNYDYFKFRRALDKELYAMEADEKLRQASDKT